MSLPFALSEPVSHTRTYGIWSGMKTRCLNPNSKDYAAYGARGVAVCERWKSFGHFLDDMGEAPSGLTLDRIDGEKGYEPGNCRWATRKQQNRNQRDLNNLVLDGVEKCLSAWAEEFGMRESTLRNRLRNGWAVHRAITTPVRKHKPYERSIA